jgi:hypothetical protein
MELLKHIGFNDAQYDMRRLAVPGHIAEDFGSIGYV